MDMPSLVAAVLKADADTLKRIEDVLMGRDRPQTTEAVTHELMSVGEARKFLNLSYPKFHRLQQDGVFDVVMAKGRGWICKQSLIEFAEGRRRLSEEVLARHAERNAVRRKAYREQQRRKREQVSAAQ